MLADVFWRFRIDGQQGITMGAQAEVVEETPVEEHGGIDESAAVEVEDELAFLRSLSLWLLSLVEASKGRRAMDTHRVLMPEDLHLKPRGRMEFLFFREKASEIPWYTHRTAVLATAMLQLGVHFFGRGVAQ